MQIVEQTVLLKDDFLYEEKRLELNRLRNKLINQCPLCDKGIVVVQDATGPRLMRCKCSKKYDIYATIVKANVPVEKIEKIEATGGYYKRLCREYLINRRVEGGRIFYDSAPQTNKNIEIDVLVPYVTDNNFKSGKSLLFFGPNGCGKTVTAVWIIRDIIIQNGSNISCYYCLVKDFVELDLFINRSTFGEEFERKKKLKNYIKNCDLLVLDELGKESTGKRNVDEIKVMLEMLLKHRTENGKATILITNFRLSELTDNYTDSIVSILNENYNFILLDNRFDHRFNRR